jgi:hypothetical protein
VSDLFRTPVGHQTGAIFSNCRRWRYRLWRSWQPQLARAVFLMMNPSTADEVKNDPTVERCVRRVKEWEKLGLIHDRVELPDRMTGAEGGVFGTVEVVNVFAWRETDSLLLAARIAEGQDIVGPENDRHIVEACKDAAIVVCGWGEPGHRLLGRGAKVLELLRGAGVKPYALKINASGAPQHPLYIGYNVAPVPL